MRFPIGFSLFVVVIAICGILVIASSSSENAKHVEKEFSNDALSGQLRYYEIVTDLHVIDSGGVRVSSKNHFYGLSQVIFSAFNQSFHIYLTPKYGLFAQNFAYYEVGKDGDKREMTLNTDHLYEGYVKDSSDSEVSLSFDNDQSLIGSVRVNSEIYYFEPARLHNLARRTGDILAYRNSDVDEGFMRSIVWQNYSLKTFDLPKSSAFYIQRDERDAHPVLKNRCSLKIVADYSFFKIVGQGDRLSVSRYLINVIDRVNTIFTRQDWGVGRRNQRMINMGFMIKEMLIHTSPYDTPHDPYNTAAIDEHFDVQLLLKRFTEAEGTTKYCLVHLFTALTFKNGVMGLSYVGGPEISQFGGICSISYNGISYNTGLSTARSKMGRNVITRGTDLILAHEFGHSWGSNHDETPDCLPDLQNGGPYLMNPSVTSGRDINNPVFSPCSVRMIGEVLFKKSAICFETEVSSFCGNGLVERETRTSNYSEQCDSGGFLPHKGDACCTAECRLKEGALCSPGNSPCCSDKCQFMPAGSVCSPENPAQCMQTAYCTGLSAVCPQPLPLPDGVPCIDSGECINGVCVPFCEKPSVNRSSCLCTEESDACMRCCVSNNSQCEPYKRTEKYILKDGSICAFGVCKKAKCIRQPTDMVSHLWNVFEEIGHQHYSTWLKDNLALVIILTTSIVFVIPCIIVSRMDMHRKERLRKRKKLRFSYNQVNSI